MKEEDNRRDQDKPERTERLRISARVPFLVLGTGNVAVLLGVLFLGISLRDPAPPLWQLAFLTLSVGVVLAAIGVIGFLNHHSQLETAAAITKIAARVEEMITGAMDEQNEQLALLAESINRLTGVMSVSANLDTLERTMQMRQRDPS